MTFLEALAQAEKTGAVLTRREDTDRSSCLMSENPHKAWHWWALDYDGKTIRRFYWDPGISSPKGIKSNGVDALTLEDVRADDWQAHPLDTWFLRQRRNVWNPLGVQADVLAYITNTGGSLSSTGGNHVLAYTGVPPEPQR